MDKYAINVAVLPSLSVLAQFFAGDAEWQLVFSDQISAVYERKMTLNPAPGI